MISLDRLKDPIVARLLNKQRRAAGEMLFEECAQQDSLYMLREGKVEVLVADLPVATLKPGTLIGEIGLFAASQRTASVRAIEDVEMLELTRSAYEELRAGQHPLAHAIEAHALGQLMHRMRTLVADLRLQARGMGLPEPEPGEPAPRIDVPVPPSALLASIEGSRAFEGTHGDLKPLLMGASMATLPAGALLAGQGFKATPLFLLTSGEIEWRLSVDHRLLSIATIEPGELFALGLHVDRKARPVEYVVSEDASFVMLEADVVAQVFRQNTPTGSRLRTAAIRALADRVLQLNARYTLLKLTAVEVVAAPAKRPEAVDPQEFINTLLPDDDDDESDFSEWDSWFDLVDDAVADPVADLTDLPG